MRAGFRHFAVLPRPQLIVAAAVLACVWLSAFAADQPVTSSPNSATTRVGWVGRSVASILDEVRSQSYQFVYSSQVLPESVRVDKEPLAGEPLARVREVLAVHGLSLTQISNGVFAVVRDPHRFFINGVAVDARDGSPLHDVRIEVRPGGTTHRTNANGEFSLELQPIDTEAGSNDRRFWLFKSSSRSSHYRLLASAAGYRSTEVDVSPANHGDVVLRLEPFATQMDATIVTAQRYPFSVKAAESALPIAGGPLTSQASLGDDPIRALARLPGIVQNGSAGSLNIRGGAANEVLILLDGFPLRQAFHMPGYRSLLSIFDPGAVSAVDIYTGAIPARFGGRMSGVLDIRTIDATELPRRSLGVGFLSARARVGASLSDQTDIITATRYGAAGYLKDAIEPAIGHPTYADSFNRVSTRLGESTDITVNALLSRDSMTIHRDGFDETSDLSSQLAYLWLHSSSSIGRAATWSNWFGHTYIAAQRTGDLNSPQLAIGGLSEERSANIWDLRSTLSIPFADVHNFEIGGEWSHGTANYAFDSRVQFGPLITDRFAVPPNKSQSTTLQPSRDEIALFASERWSVTPRLTTQAGVRVVQSSAAIDETRTVTDPRISVAYSLSANSAVRAAWGRVHQFTDISEILVEDRLDSTPTVQQTDYVVLGYERQLFDSLSLRVEGYRKQQDRLRTRFQNFLNSPSLLPELSFDRAPLAARSADARGIEVYLQQTLDAWSWRLAYSWAEATETIAGREYARDWDQRNFASLGVEWRKGAWLFTGSGSLRTGRPTTDIRNLPQGGIAIGPFKGDRADTYIGVDLRAAWHTQVAKGVVTAAVQFTNLFNRRNECCAELSIQNDSAGQPQMYVKSGQSTPLVPWASLSWDF
jgi:outer membrane cobalamin receptor